MQGWQRISDISILVFFTLLSVLLVYLLILLLQAKDRLQSLIEEIARIGTDSSSSQLEIRSSGEDQSLSTTDKTAAGDERDREIEEYPRPHAVLGVSVL